MSLEKNIKIAEMMGFQKTNLGWFDAEEILLPIKLNSNTFDNNELLFDKSWDWISCVLGELSLQFDRNKDEKFDTLCCEISDSIIENDLAKGYESLNLFIDKVIAM